jgi:cytochrome c-type biogenesis protein CcmE
VTKWIGLGVLVAVCLAYLIYSASTSGTATAYYRTVAEVKGQPVGDGKVRVLGTVQEDVQRFDGGLEVRFTASQDGVSMPVDYRGALPDIFRPGIQVVVEGRFERDGVFHADQLLAKCPSRFQAKPT